MKKADAAKSAAAKTDKRGSNPDANIQGSDSDCEDSDSDDSDSEDSDSEEKREPKSASVAYDSDEAGLGEAEIDHLLVSPLAADPAVEPAPPAAPRPNKRPASPRPLPLAPQKRQRKSAPVPASASAASLSAAYFNTAAPSLDSLQVLVHVDGPLAANPGKDRTQTILRPEGANHIQPSEHDEGSWFPPSCVVR